jgi:protein-S-isoprenylcysteine O-methyltransferase Ste14
MESEPHTPARKKRNPLRWLKSTSRRTFCVYPVAIIAIELTIRGGELPFVPWGLPLLLWGYLQYHLGGNYRTLHGGGGPGIEVPPERIVDTGIYHYIRNPMYLGHMIFMVGLAITFRSWAAVALLVFHVFWFNARAKEDEVHLEQLFGDAYRSYVSRTKRWIPFIY